MKPGGASPQGPATGVEAARGVNFTPASPATPAESTLPSHPASRQRQQQQASATEAANERPPDGAERPSGWPAALSRPDSDAPRAPPPGGARLPRGGLHSAFEGADAAPRWRQQGAADAAADTKGLTLGSSPAAIAIAIATPPRLPPRAASGSPLVTACSYSPPLSPVSSRLLLPGSASRSADPSQPPLCRGPRRASLGPLLPSTSAVAGCTPSSPLHTPPSRSLVRQPSPLAPLAPLPEALSLWSEGADDDGGGGSSNSAAVGDV